MLLSLMPAWHINATRVHTGSEGMPHLALGEVSPHYIMHSTQPLRKRTVTLLLGQTADRPLLPPLTLGDATVETTKQMSLLSCMCCL